MKTLKNLSAGSALGGWLALFWIQATFLIPFGAASTWKDVPSFSKLAQLTTPAGPWVLVLGGFLPLFLVLGPATGLALLFRPRAGIRMARFLCISEIGYWSITLIMSFRVSVAETGRGQAYGRLIIYVAWLIYLYRSWRVQDILTEETATVALDLGFPDDPIDPPPPIRQPKTEQEAEEQSISRFE